MKLTNLFKKLSTKTKVVTFVATALVAIAVPSVVIAGFGPGNRPTYDYTKACNPNDNDPYDRCGSMDGPVFNSFINTPTYGDERNFNRMAEVVAGQKPTDADYGETKVATPGKEYWVRTLVHNNANQETNDAEDNFKGVAKNTRVKVDIAEGVANGVDVMSTVTADNAKPGEVWDTSTLQNENQKFSVQFVPGSARLFNSVYTEQSAGKTLPDEIVNGAQGTKIGHRDMDGNLPGCFEFEAYVYVKVKVNAPEINLEKEVRMKGEGVNDWRETVEAMRDDTVQYRIKFQNTGTATASDLALRDRLPSNLELVPGSVDWVDENKPEPGFKVSDTALFSQGGLLLGNYGAGGGGYIYFDAKVKDTVDECEALNVALIRGNGIPEQEDNAKVVIKDCVPPVVTPVYSCDALRVQKVSKFEYRFTTESTARSGAEFESYTYDFGDNTEPLTTDSQEPQTHTYTTVGEYATKVTANFTVDGARVSDSGAECMATITIPQTPTENCPIPGKEHLPKDSPKCKEPGDKCPLPGKGHLPKDSDECAELPDTGMGSVAGIFAATTAAGTVAHAAIVRRRR